MLTFEQFLESAADQGRAVNTLWERRLFDILAVAEKITAPLAAASIPHQIIGGLAVLTHIEANSEADGVMTKDADVLIRRTDLAAVMDAAERSGFEILGDRLKHPDFRADVHLHFVGERSSENQPAPHPDIDPAILVLRGLSVSVVGLCDLLRSLLISNRIIDTVCIQSLNSAGLITPNLERILPHELQCRLNEIRALE